MPVVVAPAKGATIAGKIAPAPAAPTERAKTGLAALREEVQRCVAAMPGLRARLPAPPAGAAKASA